MAVLCNFNGLASWRYAEISLQSVNLTKPQRQLSLGAYDLLHQRHHIFGPLVAAPGDILIRADEDEF